MRYENEKIVTIDKRLHKLLKAKAVKEEKTMKAIIDEILRNALGVN